MHKAVRPSDYFFQFFHIWLGWVDKEKESFVYKFCWKYTLLNTVDFIFKVGQHACLGHTQQAHDVKLTLMRRDNVA